MKEDVQLFFFYSDVNTYVGLYGSGLFNFGSHLTLFACFLGFDIPTSSFIFIGNAFIILVYNRFYEYSLCLSGYYRYVIQV